MISKMIRGHSRSTQCKTQLGANVSLPLESRSKTDYAHDVLLAELCRKWICSSCAFSRLVPKIGPAQHASPADLWSKHKVCLSCIISRLVVTICICCSLHFQRTCSAGAKKHWIPAYQSLHVFMVAREKKEIEYFIALSVKTREIIEYGMWSAGKSHHLLPKRNHLGFEGDSKNKDTRHFNTWGHPSKVGKQAYQHMGESITSRIAGTSTQVNRRRMAVKSHMCRENGGSPSYLNRKGLDKVGDHCRKSRAKDTLGKHCITASGCDVSVSTS